uniref:Uncharacterized protein n=1 Tax=Mycena chlorophos TaxID=658473 RepID=A0ABQ0L1F9_MYCCL|nr:predicted protein [Mycena chlorophos]
MSSSKVNNDEDEDENQNAFNQRPPSSTSTETAVPAFNKITKKRRRALEKGENIGPDRKNGQTDFIGVRRAVMDAHLAKFPRNGQRHPTSHFKELFDAFDAQVPWRLQWHEEPPTDAKELAHLLREPEDDENTLKKERDAWNHKKLRYFYNRIGSSTGGSKGLFKKVLKNMTGVDGPPPHRAADWQYYAKHPDYHDKVQAEFDSEYPDAETLGKYRVAKYNEISRRMFLNEDDDVKTRVRNALATEHTGAVDKYKLAVSGQKKADDLDEEDRAVIRNRLPEVVVPLLNDLQKASGFTFALHAARVECAEGSKPNIDFRSMFSGVDPDAPSYKNFKVSDPKRSGEMAQHWARHVYNIFEVENPDLAQSAMPSAVPSAPTSARSAQSSGRHVIRRERDSTPQSQRSIVGQNHDSTTRHSPTPMRRVPNFEGDEDEDGHMSTAPLTPADKRQAIVAAVDTYRKRLWDEYNASGHKDKLNPPPECLNPVLIDRRAIEELGLALSGVRRLEILDCVRYPRHKPIGDESFDEPPAIWLSQYLNIVPPLVRAWICNPDLEVSERRVFCGRTYKMSLERLEQEAERLEDVKVWAEAKRRATRRRNAEAAKEKKRKRGGDASDEDDDYNNNESEAEGAARKKSQGTKKKKTRVEKHPMPSQAKRVEKPRPKPKRKLARKKSVTPVEPPMELENTLVDEQLMEVEVDGEEITLHGRDELADWVRTNPNVINEEVASAMLNAALEQMDDDTFDYDVQDVGEVDGEDEATPEKIGEQASEVEGDEEEVEEEVGEPAKPTRAAKAQATSSLTQLYERYRPTRKLAPGKAGPAPAKKAATGPDRVPRTHSEMEKGGLDMAFRPVKKNPNWARDGKDWLLGLPGGGDEWEKMVELWYQFEGRFSYQEPDATRPTFIFSTERRPDAVGIWVSVARPLKVIPCIKNLKAEEVRKFGRSVRRWWHDVNPAWRKVNAKGLLSNGEHTDWYSLFWPGPNGFLAVMACLYWWGAQIEGKPKDCEGWVQMVQDVEWVIGNMMRNMIDKAEMSGGSKERGMGKGKGKSV